MAVSKALRIRARRADYTPRLRSGQVVMLKRSASFLAAHLKMESANNGTYDTFVRFEQGKLVKASCTCPDWKDPGTDRELTYRGVKRCKHVFGVGALAQDGQVKHHDVVVNGKTVSRYRDETLAKMTAEMMALPTNEVVVRGVLVR